MAFPGFGHLLKAAIPAATGYMAGEQIRQQTEQKQRELKEARERQVEKDRLADMLAQIQIEQGQLALQRARQPQAPSFKVNAGGVSTEVGSADEAQRLLEQFGGQQDDVNWQTVTTADGIMQVNPRTGQTRPTGLRPPPPATQTAEPSWQVVQTDQGLVQVNPKTGQTRPLGLNAPQKPVPQSVARAQAESAKAEARIDRALEALKNQPSSVGPTRRFDIINQFRDPEGVDLRADIADISSLVILDRSGAAVSVHEMERLKPFLPNVTDRPEVVRRKLERMKRIIQEEREIFEMTTGLTGGAQQQPDATIDLGDTAVGRELMGQQGQQGDLRTRIMNDPDLTEQERRDLLARMR